MKLIFHFINSNMHIPRYAGLLSFNASLLLFNATELLSNILNDI